ncbi:hypothetical protein KC19_8G033400 [Ceratodon purpureus]|uniref:TIR domain-containing protein n=1 Tax=Ceratodon purpureus TaxID=3225 RepID=A0A8T0GWQ2_CERPU|nr:hypothetical protein KC19_8G033400 [Ceratodon purpureus]
MDDQSLELSRPRKRHRGQCSSSFAATDVDYDVFLNHRGPDVKAGFISHLDEALRTAGLNPFFDKASLRKGHPAFSSINDALEVAKIHVAVVSKGYAESKYCLNELVAMMRSGKPVIPVFYGVEPVDLRWVENGLFAKAFDKHKLKRTPEEVEEWRDALLKLAEITGICFCLSDYKGNEAELKGEVVDVVLSFTCRDEVVPIEHHLVGVEDKMHACIKTMEEFMFGPTRLLGLVGMGGIGKTTLAKAIYNHFVGCKKFQAMSFLQVDHNSLSIMEEVGSSLSKRLQKQLLMDIFHVPQKNQGSYKRWFDKISSQGPILVVLDDLLQKSEFDQVILNMSLLAPGSCIIVTSRDRHVLNEIGGQCNFFLHEVRPLGSDDSRQLFNFHAFGDGEAPPKFKNLANDVSKACGGLPLALKVVGSSLIGKKSDEDLECIWPEAADALKEDADVMDVLRWSYNCLSKQEKMMFLDIACIFCGWWRDEAMEVWKSCKESSCCGLRTPHKSLAKLIDKSLIFIDVTKEKQGGGVLAMHGLLQELGKNVGMDDGSHIWVDIGTCGVEVINQGPMKVRALNLANGGEHEVENEYFTKMTNLHFLVLDGCFINGDLTIISKKLRSLRWRHMPMIQRPPILNLINLISLDFSHSTKAASFWAESNPALEGCPNLLNLDMTNCTSIITLPDSIGQLSRLQLLDLEGCRNLQKLPSTIGQLTQLEKLRLHECESLESLPDSIPTLPQLQHLLMYTCTSMSKVPETMGLMTGLTEFNTDLATEWHAVVVGQQHGLKDLIVYNCSDEAITWLDRNSSLAHLHLLSLFTFRECPAMSKLPHTIGLLTNLDWLSLWRCENLRELPNSIGQLKLLTGLYLRSCSSLKTLPDCLGALTSLEQLWIAHCRSLTKLPESIGHLSRLRRLYIEGCGELQPLPESLRQLSELELLRILDCGSLEGLGVLRVLPGLRIWGCTSVTTLSGSCLMVLDRNYDSDPSWYRYDDYNQYYSVRGDLKEMRVVEANDCGFLRLVQDAESGRSILQRVHKLNCCKLVMLKDRGAI